MSCVTGNSLSPGVYCLVSQVTRCKEQVKSQKKDSDAAATESKKALSDVKSRYEKELAAWNKEREAIKKNDKQVFDSICVLLEFFLFRLTENGRKQ